MTNRALSISALLQDVNLSMRFSRATLLASSVSLFLEYRPITSDFVFVFFNCPFCASPDDAVLAAGLDKVLANPNLDPKLTLFAPPEMDERLLESAWLPQLLDNLLYYMLEGRELSVDLGFIQGFVPSVNFQREQVLILAEPPTIDGVELDPTDTLACNGVIHEVFDELQPASSDSGNDIVEMLSRNQECKTLVDLIGPAGLVSDLQGEGPFTVFGKQCFAMPVICSKFRRPSLTCFLFLSCSADGRSLP